MWRLKVLYALLCFIAHTNCQVSNCTSGPCDLNCSGSSSCTQICSALPCKATCTSREQCVASCPVGGCDNLSCDIDPALVSQFSFIFLNGTENVTSVTIWRIYWKLNHSFCSNLHKRIQYFIFMHFPTCLNASPFKLIKYLAYIFINDLKVYANIEIKHNVTLLRYVFLHNSKKRYEFVCLITLAKKLFHIIL